MKSQIRALAKRLGIDKIGFTTADDFDHIEASLRLAIEEERQSGFEHPNIEERIRPRLSVANAKTIISIAVSYPHQLPQLPQKTGYKRGKFSPSSWGEDYHLVLKRKLTTLAQEIEALYGSMKTSIMVDTGALVDVAVAQRAGLGFVGKNGLLITKEHGSYVFLGELITDLEIEPDKPVDYDCGTCERCLTSCPTKALIGDGHMDAKRCLSFQTQNKGMVPEAYRKRMKTVIYGCDICQMTCPYNKGISYQGDLVVDPELAQPELVPFLDLSNREFKMTYGHLAGSWRGKAVLQRNAIIALANHHDKSALPKLMAVVETTTNQVHRATAIWAIGQISPKPEISLVTWLEQVVSEEAQVLQEKKQVLETWRANHGR